jgi:thymidine kinase
MSRIEVILGCMFSGKTTELIRRVKRYTFMHKNCLVINSILDHRAEGDTVKTHENTSYQAIKLDSLKSFTATKHYQSADVIGIDECQFFSDLYEFVLQAEIDQKILILAGLDGDIERKPFGSILQCIPLCDEVVKLTAIDQDGSLAIFTRRKDESVTKQVQIGSNDYYEAVSRKNYLAKKNITKQEKELSPEFCLL